MGPGQDGSFLLALARELQLAAAGTVEHPIERTPLTLAGPPPQRDAAIFHTRLMPAGWDARTAGHDREPGFLFSLAG